MKFFMDVRSRMLGGSIWPPHTRGFIMHELQGAILHRPPSDIEHLHSLEHLLPKFFCCTINVSLSFDFSFYFNF